MKRLVFRGTKSEPPTWTLSTFLSLLRLALLCILRCRVGDFAAHLGLKCSSLCKMNRGTSQRSACASVGFWEYPSVYTANVLIERRAILCLLGFWCQQKMGFDNIYNFPRIHVPCPVILTSQELHEGSFGDGPRRAVVSWAALRISSRILSYLAPPYGQNFRKWRCSQRTQDFAKIFCRRLFVSVCSTPDGSFNFTPSRHLCKPYCIGLLPPPSIPN